MDFEHVLIVVFIFGMHIASLFSIRMKSQNRGSLGSVSGGRKCT
jgi:hypothetical protein